MAQAKKTGRLQGGYSLIFEYPETKLGIGMDDCAGEVVLVAWILQTLESSDTITFGADSG
jgi:hypothetical protein